MKPWIVVLVVGVSALIAGAYGGFKICDRFFLDPARAEIEEIEREAERQITELEAKIKKVSEQKAEEFIREIEDADDLDVLDDYLSPELRDRLRDLIDG